MFIKPIEQPTLPASENRTKVKKKDETQSFADNLESIIGADAVEFTKSDEENEKNKADQQAQKEKDKNATAHSTENGLNITV